MIDDRTKQGLRRKTMAFWKEILAIVIFFSWQSKLVGGQTQKCYYAHGSPSTPIQPDDMAFNEKGVCNSLLSATADLDSNDHTNGIQSFCVAADFGFPNTSISPPIKLGHVVSTLGCYRPVPAPPGSQLHAAGADPNYALLQHLVLHRAQSFQPFNDLPYVDKYAYGFDESSAKPSFVSLIMPKRYNPLPMEGAPNPYFVEVTGISMKGELLHNFLHFRIFANLSVALGRSQEGKRGDVLHGRGIDQEKGNQFQERPNHATGKISALLIMVKDQDGWPIGDFSTPVPCYRTCSKYSHDVYYGDKRNAVPCSYTSPFASTHPGMFLFDADPGRYCTKYGDEDQQKENSTRSDPRLNPQKARLEGVREVHATWSFHHDTCNFASKLHIQTLVFEDVETVYRANVPFLNGSDVPVLFGWTAQYNILKSTKESLGSPDYVDLRYFKERDAKSADIDCHVPLFDAVKTVPFTFQKFLVPSVSAYEASLENDREDMKVASRTPYHASIAALFAQQRQLRYLGYAGGIRPGTTLQVCRPYPADIGLPTETISQFLLNDDADHKGVRCPCPALASEEPLENRTADPARLHGRLIHASHMAIAYMFLTPIGCFVVRYYKETFVTVFCLQEYWWYMWHVVTLIVACLFNVGAITSIARKKEAEIQYNQNLKIHVVFGAMSIFVFYLEIFTGFFRVADPKKRMRQIFSHWLIGTMNNLCAVMSMFAMAWVDQSGFTCNTAITCFVWLLFVIICYVVMEYNMRQTDKKLRLIPRRSYLPPPVKRLFIKEPPGRSFRVGMLIFLIMGLIAIQIAMSFFIWNEDGRSCHEELKESDFLNKKKTLAESVDLEEGGGDGDEENEDY